MTEHMKFVAAAAMATVIAAPAVAQTADTQAAASQSADPFVSTQGANLTSLSDEAILAIAAGAVFGLARVLDDDGNDIGTTTTTN